MTSVNYPWYGLSRKQDLAQQGDILIDVPIVTSEELIPLKGRHITPVVDTYNMIILSQSCDLDNPGKISRVQLAPIFSLKEFMKVNSHLNNEVRLEDLRKNHIPRYYLMNKNTSSKFKKDYIVVDFGKVHTVKFKAVGKLCSTQNRRLRLLSPYREQLSQHYARYFMRVGLPLDIPKFTKPIRLI